MLTMLVSGFAALDFINLGILAALMILERAPGAVAVATAAGLRPSHSRGDADGGA